MALVPDVLLRQQVATTPHVGLDFLYHRHACPISSFPLSHFSASMRGRSVADVLLTELLANDRHT